MSKQVSTIQVVGKQGNLVGYKRSGSKKAGTVFGRNHTTEINNPKTNAQLYQRAIAATITKAYALMKSIVDHSFEGKSAGAESMQYFNSRNMNLLRNNILDDLRNETTAAQQLGVVVAPKTIYATPGPYIISEGTLTPTAFEVKSVDGDILAAVTFAEGATVADWLAAQNVVSGDIFTIVALGIIDNTGAFASQYGQLASQPSTNFGFVRLKVKESAFNSTTAMASATIADVFTVEAGGAALRNIGADDLSDGILISEIVGSDSGYMGVIRSRNNSKLRSNCQLLTNNTSNNMVQYSTFGIKTDYLLNAWIKDADTLGQSRLILEGGNF